jgi:uncharacterized protein
MSTETGKKAIDFLLCNSLDRLELEVDFFVGEPLMNFETIKEIVAYAREKEVKLNKRISFTLTTNGILLDDDSIEFINREMSNVVLSLDGRKEVNDNMRGTGVYDKIVPKYKKLVSSRDTENTSYYVRGTFTKHNLNFTEDVLDIYNNGFQHISVEPVQGTGHDWDIKESDLPQIYAEYEHLAELLHTQYNGKFNFFHFLTDLNQGPCAIKRLRGCGAGNDYLAVTPEGDIYPCHQFVGIESFKMGNVLTGSFNSERKTQFVNAHIYSKPECTKCWAKFYCSGGCVANSFQTHGDILKTGGIYCDLQKKRLECALMLKVRKALESLGEPLKGA